jgi:acyl carrier protein
MGILQASAVKDLMVDYLVNRAGIDPALIQNAAAELEHLGVDSLATVEMLWELEDKLGVHLTDNAIKPNMTLDDLAELVARSAAQAA